ncbi:MAG: EamA family transporter [Pseudomonadota bacterium]
MTLTPRTWQLAAAFAAVYLIWGSTYLVIRVGVESLPPALFAGARFLPAAALLLLYAFSRGARLPQTRRDWGVIAATAILMLVGGNGLVTWSEQWIESNQAALLVATSALWMTGLGAIGPQGERPGGAAIAGLLLGFAGVALLVSSGLKAQVAPWYAYAGISLSPLLWAAGSILARRYPVATSPLMMAALQTLIAGALLILIGLISGEAPRWNWNPQGLAALAYLTILGSCVGYGAYIWLVHQVTPTQLGTYAYVNPAVAVLLGWWILDERLSPAQIVGTLVILCGVLLVTVSPKRKPVSA